MIPYCNIPPDWIVPKGENKQEEFLVGIDEAGRGPVLGPMVYSLFIVPTRSAPFLKSLQVADSKILTPEKREEICELFIENSNSFGWKVDVLSANCISNGMLSKSKYNLNMISHDSAMNLVQFCIDKGIKISKLFVDTVGPAKTYQEKLCKRFPMITEVKVAEKADSLYDPVKAASIIAKVVRDFELANWNSVSVGSNREFGSGYPGDPKSKNWLLSNLDPLFGYPRLIRFSWSTVGNILTQRGYEVKWISIEEDTENARRNFFAPQKKGATAVNLTLSFPWGWDSFFFESK